MERRTFLGRVLAGLGGLFGATLAGRAAVKDEPHVHRGYGPCKYRSCDCYKFDD